MPRSRPTLPLPTFSPLPSPRGRDGTGDRASVNRDPPVSVPAVDQPSSKCAAFAPARNDSASRVVSAISTSAPPPKIGPVCVVTESLAIAAPPLANAPIQRGPTDQGNTWASSASECRWNRLEQQSDPPLSPMSSITPTERVKNPPSWICDAMPADLLQAQVEVRAADLHLERQPAPIERRAIAEAEAEVFVVLDRGFDRHLRVPTT